MMSQTSGIGWSLDESRMYYVDSLTRGIGVVDCDGASGSSGNRRLFAAVGDLGADRSQCPGHVQAFAAGPGPDHGRPG